MTSHLQNSEIKSRPLDSRGLREPRMLMLDELEQTVGDGDPGIVVTVLLRGKASWYIPELGQRCQLAGSWALLSDSGSSASTRLQAEGDGIALLLDPNCLDGAMPPGCHIPPKLACLVCPKRNASFYHSGSSSGRIEAIAESLMNERKPPSLSANWMCLSRVYELLARIMDQPELLESPDRQSCGLARDKASLMAVAHDLKQNCCAPHSLASIARRHHLNEFKLKKGFREEFGTTVFGYLREQRMQLARKLLNKGQSSVIEVANEVGYSNPSHFARAFREVHGINPSDVTRYA